MERVALVADCLSLGDLVERRRIDCIQSNHSMLLHIEATLSSLLPGEYMSGQINMEMYPVWFSMNFKERDRKRKAEAANSRVM